MGKPDSRSRRNDNGYGIGSKTDAKHQRRKAIMLLHNKRRGSDIGKQHPLGKTKLKDITYIPTVVNDGKKTLIHICPTCILATYSRQGLRKMQTSEQQQYT